MNNYHFVCLTLYANKIGFYSIFWCKKVSYSCLITNYVKQLIFGSSFTKITWHKKRELFNIVRVFSKWWAMQDWIARLGFCFAKIRVVATLVLLRATSHCSLSSPKACLRNFCRRTAFSSC